MPATPRKTAKKVAAAPSRTRVTPGSAYGAGWGQEVLIDLEVPSGTLAQVRRPGIAGLIKAGVLDSLDALTGIVQTDHVERVKEGKDPHVTAEEMKKMARDKDKVVEALALTDKVVEYVVVQPTVLRPVVRDEGGQPVLEWRGKTDNDTGEKVLEEIDLPDSQREEGVAYTDVIAIEDKMYIFQFVVGGVTDLATFREEFKASMGGLETL